jgi:hypothetical protein
MTASAASTLPSVSGTTLSAALLPLARRTLSISDVAHVLKAPDTPTPTPLLVSCRKELVSPLMRKGLLQLHFIWADALLLTRTGSPLA